MLQSPPLQWPTAFLSSCCKMDICTVWCFLLLLVLFSHTFHGTTVHKRHNQSKTDQNCNFPHSCHRKSRRSRHHQLPQDSPLVTQDCFLLVHQLISAKPPWVINPTHVAFIRWKRVQLFTFVLFLDLLPPSMLGLSFMGILPVTTSKRVGRSFIRLNRRFLLRNNQHLIYIPFNKILFKTQKIHDRPKKASTFRTYY